MMWLITYDSGQQEIVSGNNFPSMLREHFEPSVKPWNNDLDIPDIENVVSVVRINTNVLYPMDAAQ